MNNPSAHDGSSTHELDAASPTSTPATPAVSGPVSNPFAELATMVVGSQPLGAVMQSVAELAQRTLDEVVQSSVTLIRQGRARSVAFTGDLAVTLDERQYEAGFGPCMDAALSGETIEVDTADSELYPEFARQAQRRGVGHTMSVGIPMLQETSGAINLYGSDSPFTQAARDAAATFANYAGAALVNAATHAGALDEAEHLRTAMTSRAVIEQAKGVVMASRRCSADEAFDVLRKASRDSNRKLREVAQAVVDQAVSGVPGERPGL